MAHVERHHRKPCDREGCGHSFARHRRANAKQGSNSAPCTVEGCGCRRWMTAEGDRETIRARWTDPASREHSKTFARVIDAERFLTSLEDAKLRGAYVDPKAGKVAFSEWAERWYRTTAGLKPSTRHYYRQLLDNQVLPAFKSVSLAGIDRMAVREWIAALLDAGAAGRLHGPAAWGDPRPQGEAPQPGARHGPGRRGADRGQREAHLGHAEDPRAAYCAAAAVPLRGGRRLPRQPAERPRGPAVHRTARRADPRAQAHGALLQAGHQAHRVTDHPPHARPPAHGREPADPRGRLDQGPAKAAWPQGRGADPEPLRAPLPRRARFPRRPPGAGP